MLNDVVSAIAHPPVPQHRRPRKIACLFFGALLLAGLALVTTTQPQWSAAPATGEGGLPAFVVFGPSLSIPWFDLREEDGPTTGLLGLSVLVTLAASLWALRRKRASKRRENALDRARAAHRRLETALEASTDAIALFDADERLVTCNARYRALYASSADILRPGIRFEDLLRHGVAQGGHDPDDRPAEAIAAEVLAAFRRADGREIERRLADGRLVCCSETRLEDGGLIGVYRDVGELRARERALLASQRRYERLARRDPLTGLGNRACFLETLNGLLAEADRAAGPGGERHTIVLLADIDRFKEINETFGHQVGDLVLQAAAERLVSIVPDGGSVARVGTDEFALLVPLIAEKGAGSDAAKEKASALAEQVLASFRHQIVLDRQRLIVRVTLGLAIHPDHATTGSDLLRLADLALCRAKQIDRGGHVICDPAILAMRARRRTVERSLRRALAGGELDLAVQPKLSLARQRIVGVEMLLRWYDPVARENMPPGEFIPVAESSAMILDIDRWVLAEGCRRAVVWKTEHDLDLQVSINLSGAHFRRPELPDLVARTLDETGLEPRLLEIEMTEGVLVQDRKMSEYIIRQLHDLGVCIALDDFGTGYSSLAYLRDLPLDRLKIDRSFVMDLETNPRNRAIVKTFIGLGHELGMTIVAEGVETDGQLRLLEALGCDDVQGYLLTRPMPQAALLPWLEAGRWKTITAGADHDGESVPDRAAVATRPHRGLVDLGAAHPAGPPYSP
ncbi:MAG: EAL domain-containing protein [Geminicoccaceae bacterium]|nr:EAL domain-containing protein [Geminicoccaceae bacterium]